MERCAMFIDAGYLLAEAGDLLFDTLNRTGKKSRTSCNCNYKELLPRLEKLASEDCRLPLLRIYWYDAAPDGFPTSEHKRIARLPNVKVRLGRIIGGNQKGVDALIYRDLMTLAREHAIVTGYLLSGDEDLREGVIVAQDMGVRIILLGVASRRRSNQSDFLIQEADEHIIVKKEILEPCFSESNAEPRTRPNEEVNRAREIGREFANKWLKDATPEQIAQLRTQHSRHIPSDIDGELLRRAERTFGSLQDRDICKRNLREGFWSVI